MIRYRFYISLSILFLLLSCKSEIEVDTPSRIKYKTYSNESGVQELKYEYKYADDKLVSEILSKKDVQSNTWYESYDNEITYENNIITSIGYYYNLDTKIWEEVTKTIYTLENGVVAQICTFDTRDNNVSSTSNTISFKYTNSKVSEIIVSWGFKWVVNYSNGLITDFTVFKKGSSSYKYPSSKCKYSYIDGNLKYIDFYYSESKFGDFSSIPSTRYEYVYSNNKVFNTSLSTYSTADSNWNNESYTSYKYNSDGDIIQQLEKDGTKITFEYESGNGNSSLFKYFTTDLYMQPYSKVKGAEKINLYNPNSYLDKFE